MITPKLTTTATNPSGALIGYDNLLTASTTSDAEKALIPNTFERWRPASGAVTVKFQMAAAAEVDYIGIAAHALSGETFLLQTAATVGGATTDVDSFSPQDNSAIMATFEPRTIQEVIFTGTLVAASEIGIVYAGAALQMPRNIYGGHSPMALSAKTDYQANMSETGQFLGRDITSQGTTGAFSWQHLDPDWYRSDFQPFVDAAKTTPFFIKWRPDIYSDETAFGQTTSDITPTNTGGGLRLMSASFNMTGHADT